MEFDLLVAEIVKRVEQKLDNAQTQECCCCKKPKLLVLTARHGECCHAALECPDITRLFDTECALAKDYAVDVDEYEAVALFDLDNQCLLSLTGGTPDSECARLAMKAILMGKRVYALNCGVELFGYKDTAPKAYYAMLEQKLELLKQSGVIFCENEELPALLEGVCPTSVKQPEKVCPCVESAVSRRLDKRVVTERDVQTAINDGVGELCVRSNAILTDLARELAKEKKVTVTRD